jgi:predicted O-methyltransferase YrrM
MATSVQPLVFEDYGAGDSGEAGTSPDSGGSGVATRQTTLGEMTRRSSSGPRWGLLLFRMTRELRPSAVLELGTCVGVSAAYIGAALEMNGGGRLITLEGGTALVERARRTLGELGLTDRVQVVHGPFQATLDDALEQLSPVDLAFIDGHHLEEPTLRYTEQVLPHLSPEAVLAYDDIHWSDGMIRAWRRLEQDPRFALTVDLGGMGIATVSRTPGSLRTSIAYA